MGQGQRVFLEVLLFGLLASGHLGSVKVSLETNNPELPHFRQVSADHHLEDENFATLRYSQEASQHSSNKDICSPHVAGQEGHGHEGLVLEKTYILVTSEQGRKQQETFHRYLTPPISCNYTSSPLSLLSYKTRIYPEVVQVYKHLGKGGKLGTNHFEMLPSSSTCGEHDLSPRAILKMIKLGEYLFKRYHKHLPVLQQVPEKILKFPACMPSQEFFQSTSALLHGLLTEKQFMRSVVQKLTPERGRGLGTHCWCDSIHDVDIFMQKSYKHELEIFKDHGTPFVETLKSRLAEKVGELSSAKNLLRSLSAWVCEFQHVTCNHGNGCMNLSREDVRNLLHAISAHNEYLSTNSLFASYAIADTYLSFVNIFSWFSYVNGSPEDLKVDVVDDFFLIKFLTVLGYTVKEPIYPGTRVIVEQYRKEKLDSRAKFWKVFLNGRVVTDFLISCKEHSFYGVCGVDTIKSFWQSLADKNMFPVCKTTRDEL